jgi:hypothetical protein
MRAAAQAITSKQVETNVSLVVSLVEQRSARAEQQKTQTNHGGPGSSSASLIPLMFVQSATTKAH